MSGAGFLLLGVLALFVLAGLSLLAGRRQRRHQTEMQARLNDLRGGAVAAADEAGPAVVTADAWSGPAAFQRWQARADVIIQAHHLLAGALLLSGLAAVLTWFLGPVVGLAVPMGIALAAIAILVRLASRRLGAFVDGLPFFLDTLRQLLMVGNSMQQALQKASDNASPALQRYLAPMIRRINNGAPVPESIQWLADRLEVAELHMLAAAVETNFRFGGRMSVVLANLVQILRDRARVERELKAATAEIRMGAIVLCLLPVVVAAIILLTNPSYILFFTDTAQGRHLLIAAAGFQLLGMALMRRVMRLEF